MKQDEMDLGVKFKPPTLEQVKQEGLKTGLPEIECEKFHSYFTSNGWFVGRVKMKSWTAALNNWRLNWIQGQTRDYALGRRSVYELTKIIEAKQKIADSLKRGHHSVVAGGGQWDGSPARLQYVKLMKEIRELNEQLAGM